MNKGIPDSSVHQVRLDRKAHPDQPEAQVLPVYPETRDQREGWDQKEIQGIRDRQENQDLTA